MVTVGPRVQQTIDDGLVKEETGVHASRNRLQTTTLLNTIEEHAFDACIGGARRDEEKARAKERFFSHRDDFGQWDPKDRLEDYFMDQSIQEPPQEVEDGVVVVLEIAQLVGEDRLVEEAAAAAAQIDHLVIEMVLQMMTIVDHAMEGTGAVVGEPMVVEVLRRSSGVSPQRSAGTGQTGSTTTRDGEPAWDQAPSRRPRSRDARHTTAGTVLLITCPRNLAATARGHRAVLVVVSRTCPSRTSRRRVTRTASSIRRSWVTSRNVPV